MEEASGIRQRLVKLLPWVITLAIFVFIFRRVPVSELLEALRQASLLPYLALMAPYSMIYCLVDAFVLTQAVTWFNRPVRYTRILPVRAAAYILSLLNPGLGQGGTAFYIHRREGVPFFEMAGSIWRRSRGSATGSCNSATSTHSPITRGSCGARITPSVPLSRNSSAYPSARRSTAAVFPSCPTVSIIRTCCPRHSKAHASISAAA